MSRLTAFLCIALVLVACTPRDRNTWHPAPPGGVSSARQARPDEPAPRRTAVVFAPIAIGQLAHVWPDAAERFAYDLADRIDVLGAKAEADGLAGPTLPLSDDAAWRAWPVDGTSGADLIILTLVTAIDLREELASSQGVQKLSCVARVEMRGVDTYGNVVFAKHVTGDWSGFPSPKFPGPESKPAARAAWEACSNAASALLDFLEKRNEAAPAAEATTPLIEVEVASEPPGADVLVDGIFRGTSPCILRLPARRVPIRLELTGHAAWERVTLPAQDMKIRPVLERK